MTKQCIICNKIFEPRYNLVNKQKCCSKECSKTYYKHCAEEHRKIHREEINRKAKELYRKKNPCLCRICGNPIERVFNEKATTHDECIANKCAEFIKNKQEIPPYWKKKMYNRGFTISEIRDLY